MTYLKIIFLSGLLALTMMIRFSYGQSQSFKLIRVGGYVFPPFLEKEGRQYRGITIDLINLMNSAQNHYRFVFVPTSSKRRYMDFQAGIYDMLFFENIQWGWRDRPLEASKIYLKGGEVYIAKSLPGRDQSYFDNLKGKTILGYLGYHYGFAHYNTDEHVLKTRYNALMTSSHERNIYLILSERFDIAVVTQSYLNSYLLAYPENKDRLIISKHMDQVYNHTILVRSNFSPGVDYMNQLLDTMEKSGVLIKLWQKYGIK